MRGPPCGQRERARRQPAGSPDFRQLPKRCPVPPAQLPGLIRCQTARPSPPRGAADDGRGPSLRLAPQPSSLGRGEAAQAPGTRDPDAKPLTGAANRGSLGTGRADRSGGKRRAGQLTCISNGKALAASSSLGGASRARAAPGRARQLPPRLPGLCSTGTLLCGDAPRRLVRVDHFQGAGGSRRQAGERRAGRTRAGGLRFCKCTTKAEYSTESCAAERARPT